MTTSPEVLTSQHAPAPPARRRRGWLGPAIRLAVAATLLVASGSYRLWQERQVSASLLSGRHSPIKLGELPLTLGDWVGEDTHLDPQIVSATGGTDLISRVYTNRQTGVRLELITLYGPASEVRIHMPETCYPAAGYQPAGDRVETTVPLSGDASGSTARLRSLLYDKGAASLEGRQEVVYAWNFGGGWTPYVDVQKRIERIPGIFKVQVARPILPSETRDDERGGPCHEFLSLLLPEIDRRLEQVRQERQLGGVRPPT
jgi:hypothetical protein